MNKDNLVMLTNVIYNHSLNYPDEHIDLVNAWLSLNVSRPILALMDNDSDYFRKAITVRPDETIANIAITLNRQTDSLLRKLIDHQKTEFLTHGGIKEGMYVARKEWRRQNQ